jgi:hypothetical protein
VRAHYKVELVLVQELLHDVLPEREGDAAVVLRPPIDVLVWVAAWRGGAFGVRAAAE